MGLAFVFCFARAGRFIKIEPIARMFSCGVALSITPEEIVRQILDVDRRPEFEGYRMLPGIKKAEFEAETPQVVGSRIRKERHIGEPNLHVTADAKTWLGFLRRERSIVWAIIERKVRLKGPLKLLLAFWKCFPS